MKRLDFKFDSEVRDQVLVRVENRVCAQVRIRVRDKVVE